MLVPADLTDADLAACLWDVKVTRNSTDREHMHNKQHLSPSSPRRHTTCLLTPQFGCTQSSSSWKTGPVRSACWKTFVDCLISKSWVLLRWPSPALKSVPDAWEYAKKQKQYFWAWDTAGLSVSYKFGLRWNAVITRSDFKSEAIFGFLSSNYTGLSAWIFS